MSAAHKSFVIGGLLVCGLGLPQVSFGISGCNNGYLAGFYVAQVSSMNFQQVLQSLNPAAATGPASATSPNSAGGPSGGFGGNTNSLSGSLPGLGRYFFDGAGTIVGAQTSSSGATYSAGVGTYTVNIDCGATLTLATGQTFDAVVANHGQTVLFMETDAAGAGATGTLQMASSCVALSFPGSFGFSFFGATQQSASASSGATGAAAATGSPYRPYGALGTISIDGSGNFDLSQTVYQNGAVQRSTMQGTYSVGVDCSLQLQFNASSGASTAGFTPPALFRGLLLNNSGGSLTLQPNSTDALTGTIVNQ